MKTFCIDGIFCSQVQQTEPESFSQTEAHSNSGTLHKAESEQQRCFVLCRHLLQTGADASWKKSVTGRGTD